MNKNGMSREWHEDYVKVLEVDVVRVYTDIGANVLLNEPESEQENNVSKNRKILSRCDWTLRKQ